MSYALNKSGVRLGSPPGNGRVTGDDGVVYWLRVKELRRKLFKLFGDPDFHLLYPERMPDPLLNECDLNARICDANAYVKDYPDEYKARLDYAYSNFMPNVKGKNGIIVFDVKGWGMRQVILLCGKMVIYCMLVKDRKKIIHQVHHIMCGILIRGLNIMRIEHSYLRQSKFIFGS